MTTIAVDFGDYADTAALLADWTETDPSSIGTWTLTTPTTPFGSASVPQVLVNGTIPGGARSAIAKTFTGFDPFAVVHVSWYQYENQANPHGAANTWLEAADTTYLANAAGEVTVSLGWTQQATSAISSKYIQFDGLSLTDGGGAFGPFLLGSGAFYVDGALAGRTRGGWDFDPRIVYQAWEYDGQVEPPVLGTEQRLSARPVLKSTLIEFGTRQITFAEPGGTTLVSGTTTTTTPASTGVTLAVGHYLQNVVAIWSRGDGTFHRVRFPLALCTAYSMKDTDKTEVGVSIELEARPSAVGATLYYHDQLDTA